MDSSCCAPVPRSPPVCAKPPAPGPDAQFVSKLGGALQEADESLLWLELLREECAVPVRDVCVGAGVFGADCHLHRDEQTHQREAENRKRKAEMTRHPISPFHFQPCSDAFVPFAFHLLLLK